MYTQVLCTHNAHMPTSCTQANLPAAPEQGPQHTPPSDVGPFQRPGNQGREVRKRVQGHTLGSGRVRTGTLSSHIPGPHRATVPLCSWFPSMFLLFITFPDLQSKTSNFTVTGLQNIVSVDGEQCWLLWLLPSVILRGPGTGHHHSPICPCLPNRAHSKSV